jgi:hypothetical protein
VDVNNLDEANLQTLKARLLQDEATLKGQKPELQTTVQHLRDMAGARRQRLSILARLSEDQGRCATLGEQYQQLVESLLPSLSRLRPYAASSPSNGVVARQQQR